MKLLLKNDPAERKRLGTAFQEFASSQGLSKRIVLSVGLALEELFTNTISYGFDGPGEHLIETDFSVQEGKLIIRLCDDGRAFDPTQHPPPNIDLPLDEKPIGGLGIHMVRRSVDEIEYRRSDGRNILLLVKKVAS